MYVDASAPGKVILAGEHFVVHGGLALALAVDKYLKVRISYSEFPIEIHHLDSSKKDYLNSQGKWIQTSGFRAVEAIEIAVKETFDYLGEKRNLKLEISSAIPQSAGMGSSASIAAAIVDGVSKYLGHELTKKELIKVASTSEKVIHGDPSGIDLSTVIHGGLVLFDGSMRHVKKNIKDIDLSLVVGDSLTRRSTSMLVGNVSEMKRRQRKIFSSLIHINNQIVHKDLESILHGDLDTLGGMFNVSHGLLRAIGVSTLKLEKMIFTATRAGALGAKLTGAGGGGCIIALSRREENKKVMRALESLECPSFFVKLDKFGVSSSLNK